MAKKQSNRTGRSSKKTSKPPPSLDRRSLGKSMADIHNLLQSREFESIDEINAFLKQTLASGQALPSSANLSVVEQAQDLMYQAWDAHGAKRVRLARQALEIFPDCADAYVLLAEETAKTPQEAQTLYQQALKAAERTIGPQDFQEFVGHFWGILETRPYMRAREGLAHILWFLGEKTQAIAHASDMLRLNPGDNQGIRYVLVNWLFQTNDIPALNTLLNQYPDDGMATWCYTRALVAFRELGPVHQADLLLEQALNENRFVPRYLLGTKKLPGHPPAFIGFGDENEAIEYALSAFSIWQNDRAALDWLKSFIASSSISTST